MSCRVSAYHTSTCVSDMKSMTAQLYAGDEPLRPASDEHLQLLLSAFLDLNAPRLARPEARKGSLTVLDRLQEKVYNLKQCDVG